jgi:hypothetical protein
VCKEKPEDQALARATSDEYRTRVLLSDRIQRLLVTGRSQDALESDRMLYCPCFSIDVREEVETAEEYGQHA